MRSCPYQFPVTPGWDVAGVVVGDSVADTPEFQIGDEVIAYARKDVLGARHIRGEGGRPRPRGDRKA